MMQHWLQRLFHLPRHANRLRNTLLRSLAVAVEAGHERLARCLPFTAASGLVLLVFTSVAATADEDRQSPSFSEIDREVQEIKQEILDLNRDLSLLEEDLLHPPERRLTVFLSLDRGATMDIDVLQIDLNGEILVNYQYTNEELEALRKGGVHKPYVGELRKGSYVLNAKLSGTAGRTTRGFELESSVELEQRGGAKHVELQVSESIFRHTPKLSIQSW